MFFTWIKTRVRDAVVGGFAEAAEQLGLNAEAEPEGARQLLATLRALPAPDEEPEPARKRK